MEEHQLELKLFMVLLGANPPGRNVEQHDYFFGIARNLKELIPAIKAFWPEAVNTLHLDGWREVTQVDGYQINVVVKEETTTESLEKLFFINLGGYQSGKLEEQHYTVLSVHEDRKDAMLESKKTVFFRTNTLKGGAGSHIDEKYGIDVDDAYRIEDILSDEYKEQYSIHIAKATAVKEDIIHLGYFKLDKIK